MVRVRYVGTVRLFVKVRVRHVGTLFELETTDFSHIVPAFCIQTQKTAEIDAECELRLLIYRLVISKSVKVASS